MPKPSDAEIIKSCLEGNADSFGGLAGRYCFYAMRIPLSAPFFFSRPDAEDVVQEVMLALYENLSGVSNIRGFLAKAAHNKCVDQIRKREAIKRLKPVMETDMPNHNSSDDNKQQSDILENPGKRINYISEYALNSRAIERLTNFMDKLGKPCGPLIKRRYFDEMSYRQLGESLEIPVNQVGVYLSRCMAHLAKNMEADKGFWEELEELLDEEAA